MRALADTEVTKDTSKRRSTWGPQRAFGYICPGCNSRYGAAQADGLIDITRCVKCKKSLAELHSLDEATRRSQRHWREKAKRR